MVIDRVVIIGLGLIGGSIAKAIAPHLEVFVHDADVAVQRAAAADGFATIAALEGVITTSTLIVVATPVDAIPATLENIANAGDVLGDRGAALVTDVCSVKSSVVAHATNLGLRFVGGHPMAGSEQHGYSAASDSLFSGARWALALTDATNLDDWFAVAGVVATLGATAVPARPEAHDRAVAAISHLPHVLASGLAAVTHANDGDLMIGLAAGSFRDGTRVARSSPRFWASVLADNGANMVPLLRTMSQELTDLADALVARDDDAVRCYFEIGEHERLRYENRNAVSSTIACADDAASRAALLDIGARGGAVTGHEAEHGGQHTVRRIHVRVPKAETIDP